MIRLFTGSEVTVEPVQLEDMEWVMLMNLKHIMKERCAAGEASSLHPDCSPSSLLLARRPLDRIDQVCVPALGSRACAHTPAADALSNGCGYSAVRKIRCLCSIE